MGDAGGVLRVDPTEWDARRPGSFARSPRSEEGRIAWDRNKGNIGNLIKYWTRGKGGVLIGWGAPCDFCSCLDHLAKYVPPTQVKGFCAKLHHRVLGVWPGREDHHGHKGKHCPC